MRQGRQEGLQEGLQQGLQQSLAEMLRLRFGKLPKRIRARLAGAGVDELLAWHRAFVDARTMEDVFAAA